MAKVALVTFYNDFNVGVNVLSSILLSSGHDVSNIFFKLPYKRKVDWFTEEATEFMEAVDCYGEIFAGNATVNRWTKIEIELLIKQLELLSPDILGFNSRTMDNILVSEVIPQVRKKINAVTLAGGFGPSLDPEIYVDFVDYVYIGEAENCIDDLVSKLEKGESIERFQNICFKRDGKIVRNSLCCPENVAFKKQSVIKKSFYIDNDNIYPYELREKIAKVHTYSTFLGRGCISSCSYCSTGNWRSLYKEEGYIIPARRNRPVDEVIDELIDVKKDTQVTFVHFRDEFMTTKTSELKRFFKLYEQKINLPFWAYLVPHQVLKSPELLKYAVDAGFVDTEIGCQSGSDTINKKIFTRFLPHKNTIEYARMLEKYEINIQYDFIIFNPAEEEEHIKETYNLLQKLPKKRAHLYLPRLFYFPMTPIFGLLEDYKDVPIDFEYYYRQALLFLICFIVTPEEFDQILSNEELNSSWQRLKSFYQQYINDNNIEFIIGTHEKPYSITTHRYKRIIQNTGLKNIIFWGDQSYYNEMMSELSGIENSLFIDNCRISEGKYLDEFSERLMDVDSIFICSRNKGHVRKNIEELYPNYKGRIFV